MGFDTELLETFSFVYQASDPESGLTEHMFDHVLRGEFSGEPRPNPDEIVDWKGADIGELEDDLERNPSHYTP